MTDARISTTYHTHHTIRMTMVVSRFFLLWLLGALGWLASPVMSFSIQKPAQQVSCTSLCMASVEPVSTTDVQDVTQDASTEMDFSDLTLIDLKTRLLDLLPRMTGKPEEFRLVEAYVNHLEKKYAPPQTLGFLNLAMGGTWQLVSWCSKQRRVPFVCVVSHCLFSCSQLPYEEVPNRNSVFGNSRKKSKRRGSRARLPMLPCGILPKTDKSLMRVVPSPSSARIPSTKGPAW